jgi:hypothetical protein
LWVGEFRNDDGHPFASINSNGHRFYPLSVGLTLLGALADLGAPQWPNKKS